jgi:hypothetical protein
MTAAYEDVLRILGLSNRTDPLTEIVAKKIIEISQTGESFPVGHGPPDPDDRSRTPMIGFSMRLLSG